MDDKPVIELSVKPTNTVFDAETLPDDVKVLVYDPTRLDFMFTYPDGVKTVSVSVLEAVVIGSAADRALEEISNAIDVLNVLNKRTAPPAKPGGTDSVPVDGP